MKLYSAYYYEKDPFNFFSETVPVADPDSIESDGTLIVWGGEDISPSLYKQTPNQHTHAGVRPSRRDLFEVACIKRAKSLGIPIIGVCRGAQLLCALSGGSLIQHVTNHHGSHEIVTHTGRKLKTNSIHHQMMNLEGTKHKVLAQTPTLISDVFIGQNNQHLKVEIEPEVVVFPELRALAIQGHPEYLTPNNEFVQYCLEEFKENALL